MPLLSLPSLRTGVGAKTPYKTLDTTAQIECFWDGAPDQISGNVWLSKAAHPNAGNANCTMINGPCLLYTSPSPRDLSTSRMPSSA